MRQEEKERLGGEGEDRGHLRWRIRAETLAGAADSDNELRWPSIAIWRGCRGGLGRRGRASYRCGGASN
jgi:hypothetical protein